MTDTGQVPGEGLPENAGMVEQPGIPAPGAYTFLDPSGSGSESVGEDDDLLLMPSAQGAWSDPQSVPPPAMVPGRLPGHAPVPGVAQMQAPGAAPAPVPQMPVTPQVPQAPDVLAAPAPVAPVLPVPDPVAPVEAVAPVHTPEQPMPEQQVYEQPGYEQGAPEQAILAQAAPQQAVAEQVVPEQFVPEQFVPEQFVPEQVVHETGAHEAGGRDSGSVDLGGVRMPSPVSTPTPPPARRPLHMGPPVPDATGGVVRSLSDRGPAGRRGNGAGQTPAAPVPAGVPGPATMGPEYLDVPREEPAVLPGPQLGEIPPQGGAPWSPQPAQPQVAVSAPAETVVPEAVRVAADTAVAAPAEADVGAPVMAPAMAQAMAPAVATAVAPEPAPVGQFVPVEGSLPTTPHLAPTPPAGMVLAEVEHVEAPEPVVVAPEPVAVAPEPEAVEAPEPVEVAEPDAAPAPAAAAAEPDAEAPAPAPEPEAAVAVPVPRDGGSGGEPEPGGTEAAEPVPEAPAGELEQPTGEPELLGDVAEPQAAPAEDVVPEAASEEAAREEAVPEAAQEEAAPEPEAGPATVEEPTTEADGAPAPGYADAEREAVLRVMRERRDIRNGFRSDPIPHEVLLRVLEAAHTAPSVGHSQPWDFVVIRSAETRRTMHELAQRQREAYAKSLPKGRAKQFKELKIEAILDTPVNIVVTADPTRGGRHTLGRHTQPQMAPYSSALAVENLWLAARAEGLGVGWVSFFDEREMVRALGLPEHLEVVAYLCVGYVDEFPEEPELMQAGWSKRRPLSWVVHEETYGRRALPGEEPHDLLQETVSNIRPLDAKALGEAWERQKRMTKPAGALGMLEIISAQLAGLSRMCPPPIPEPAAVAIFAGDHGVHAQGVTAWPQEVTGQMVANFLGGGAVCNAFANQVGAEVCVIDVGVASDLPATPGLLPRKVRPGTADFTTGPALTRDDVLAAVEVGIETARDLVAAGNKALLTGEMGIANTTASAALISVYTGVDPMEVTGRGTGINDEMHARKVDVVRRALELHQPDPADPIGVLAAVGGLEHAALVGFILGGASLRTPVVLDGVSAGAAALVARAVAPEALAACIAGHRSAEPGHVAALNKLGLRPLVDLDLRLGEGTGALLALPLVQSAARAMHEVATFDSAGVTEK
ncbi:nicotinate-nucleotide--dimethylbenzimidazole phosphoribosyltransferase [Streptomyces sp. NPDC054841]